MESINLNWFYLPLSSFELAYVLSIVFFAGVVRGVAGFGFSALCFFALAPIFNAQTIVPLMFVMELMASLHLLPKVWRHIPWRWMIILSVGTLVGTPLGVIGLVGFVNGLASIGGLVVAVYMMSSKMSHVVMRAGLIMFFLVTDLYGLAWFHGQDLLAPEVPSLLLVMMPVMLVGNQIGSVLFDRIDALAMRRVTLSLLSALASIALYSALSNL